MPDRDAADLPLVHEQRVGAVHRSRAEGDDGLGSGSSEDGYALRGEGDRAGCDDGDGTEFGPGAGCLVGVEAGAAVLDHRVVEAAQAGFQFVEKRWWSGSAGKFTVGSTTMRVCPARRLRAAACGTYPSSAAASLTLRRVGSLIRTVAMSFST